MSEIGLLLAQFGSSVGANFISDWVNRKLSSGPQEKSELEKELASILGCENPHELAKKIVELLTKEDQVELSEVQGKIFVAGINTGEITGLEIRQPTRILPGTEITVHANGADSVTGVKIG